MAGGLPHLGCPTRRVMSGALLIGISASCFVMIVAQSAATARFYAARHHQRLDENADLVGLAAANAAAGLSGTFVVNGSPTQTAMVESSGGRSQLAQISTAVVVALVLAVPDQAAAIPAALRAGLHRLRDRHQAHRPARPGEHPARKSGGILLAVITAAVVVLVGVEQGIILAMVLSLLRIVKHTYRPHTGVLVADDGLYWQSGAAGAGRRRPSPGSSCIASARRCFMPMPDGLPRRSGPLSAVLSPLMLWLVVDAEAITNLDYTAARIVITLHDELNQIGVTLAFARVGPYLQADFDRHHVTEVIGAEPYLSAPARRSRRI